MPKTETQYDCSLGISDHIITAYRADGREIKLGIFVPLAGNADIEVMGALETSSGFYEYVNAIANKE